MAQYPQHHQFSRSHVSLGGLKYIAGALATTMMAEKIKTPEQRYLLLAVVAGIVGMLETAWRDRIRAQRDACRERG